MKIITPPLTLINVSFFHIPVLQLSYDRAMELFLIDAIVYRVIRTTRTHWIPRFVRKSAIGIDTVFR